MKYSVTLGDRTVEVEVTGEAVRLDGRAVRAALTSVPGTPLRRLVLDGRTRTFALVRDGDAWAVEVAGERWHVRVVDERTRALEQLTGRRQAPRVGGVITAPMPGLVLRVEVAVGQRVDAGAGMVVLEAMKMENEIRTPGGGVVTAVHVAAGEVVEQGAPLVEVAENREG